jgi:hypothetical protein
LLNIQSVFCIGFEVKQVFYVGKVSKVCQLLLYSHLKFSIRQFELLTAFKEFLLIKMNKKAVFREWKYGFSLDLLAAEFFVSSCEIKDIADNGISS